LYRYSEAQALMKSAATIKQRTIVVGPVQVESR
jgi:hypothetical protein